MTIPSLSFRALKNSFVVKILNMEKLTVEQIQFLEEFVKNRNGIFDFDTYSFTIQKRIEYDEFIKLLQDSSIAAKCNNSPVFVTQSPRVGFGQYKGMLYSELPDSYMEWLKGNYMGKDRKIIEEELAKRSL